MSDRNGEYVDIRPAIFQRFDFFDDKAIVRRISITDVNKKTIALLEQKRPERRGARAKMPECFCMHLHIHQRFVAKRLRRPAKHVEFHPLDDNFYDVDAAFAADDFIQTNSLKARSVFSRSTDWLRHTGISGIANEIVRFRGIADDRIDRPNSSIQMIPLHVCSEKSIVARIRFNCHDAPGRTSLLREGQSKGTNMRSEVDNDIAPVHELRQESELAPRVRAVVEQLARDEVAFEGEDLAKNSLNGDYFPAINVIHVALEIP